MLLGRWWSQRSLYTKGSVVVAIPLVALLALVPAFATAMSAAHVAAERQRAFTTTSELASNVMNDLLDAETGVRGFLLTHDRGFLDPYSDAMSRLPTDLAALAAATDDRAVATQLNELIARRLALLRSYIARPSAANDRTLEEGRLVMDRIRSMIARIRDAAERRGDAADEARIAAERRVTVAAVIAVPAAIAGGALALLLFARGIAGRVRRNTTNAKRLAAGEDLLPAPTGHDDIAASGAALVEAAELLRERERAVRTSERELRVILDSLREGVVFLDARGEVVRVNPAGDDIAGFRLRLDDEAGWHERFDLRASDGIGRLDPAELPSRRAIRGLTTEPLTVWLRDRATGTTKWLQSYGAPVLDDDGKVVGGVVVTSDVTSRTIAERHLAETRQQLERSNAELREAQDRLEALALTDALTGLLNRHGFEPLAQQQLELAKRSGEGASLLFFDVDGLKDVNDRLGHTVGSDLLVAAAEAIRSAVRAADLCVRLGGDEFAVLMTGDGTAAAEVLRRVTENVERTNAAGAPFRLAMSVGTATSSPEAPRPLDDLLEEADARMYEHKRSRRSQRANV